MNPSAWRSFGACLAILSFATSSRADAVINEIVSAASARNLEWDASGTAKVGTGTSWIQAAFNDAAWQTGPFLKLRFRRSSEAENVTFAVDTAATLYSPGGYRQLEEVLSAIPKNPKHAKEKSPSH